MDQVIPTVPLAILGTIVVVVYGGLLWLLKYLLQEALPNREKEHKALLETMHDFYEKQFKAERDTYLDNFRGLQKEVSRISLVLEKLVERLDAHERLP